MTITEIDAYLKDKNDHLQQQCDQEMQSYRQQLAQGKKSFCAQLTAEAKDRQQNYVQRAYERYQRQIDMGNRTPIARLKEFYLSMAEKDLARDLGFVDRMTEDLIISIRELLSS